METLFLYPFHTLLTESSLFYKPIKNVFFRTLTSIPRSFIHNSGGILTERAGFKSRGTPDSNIGLFHATYIYSRWATGILLFNKVR